MWVCVGLMWLVYISTPAINWPPLSLSVGRNHMNPLLNDPTTNGILALVLTHTLWASWLHFLISLTSLLFPSL